MIGWQREEIIRRYNRKVEACPEGKVFHEGDCDIYASFVGICTCGLHHILRASDPEVIDELYPKFWEEMEGKALVETLIEEYKRSGLWIKCEKCNGDGYIPVAISDCLYCNGKGVIPFKMPEPMTDEEIKQIFKDMKIEITDEEYKKVFKLEKKIN